MDSSILRPVRTQHTLVNSALTADVLALDQHCFATMFAVFLRHVTAVLNSVLLCETVSGPQTAFPLIGPQCTVGVLTGTHWGAH